MGTFQHLDLSKRVTLPAEGKYPDANFDHILRVVKTKTGVTLDTSDFIVWEDRDLATSHYRCFWDRVARWSRCT